MAYLVQECYDDVSVSHALTSVSVLIRFMDGEVSLRMRQYCLFISIMCHYYWYACHGPMSVMKASDRNVVMRYIICNGIYYVQPSFVELWREIWKDIVTCSWFCLFFVLQIRERLYMNPFNSDIASSCVTWYMQCLFLIPVRWMSHMNTTIIRIIDD